MNFDQQIKQKAAAIEAVLKKYIPQEEGYQRTIMAAMNYSLLAGGKRLRPMLMSETYELFGGREEGIIEPFMAAIEMIHTYSLVHDDLPAMDNDEYRRGRKTTHVVYGEAMGILAGDGLLNYAFETAFQAFDRITGLEAGEQSGLYQKAAKALQVLGKKAGIYGMIGGQVIDMEGCGKAVGRERLDHMYQLKTGGLIEASMMVGAILAGATEEEVLKIEQIAGDVGLAFQIKDDILDVTGTLKTLGKPVHSDEKNEKATYVTLLGLEAANNEVRGISERAITTFGSLGKRNDFLLDLIKMLVNREY
ncbi:MAG TPA: polyprenyl synthetase family protein [Clostridiales bacterium]|nr:polyprenyl synthetase family protein [Clostridiales bacterium]